VEKVLNQEEIDAMFRAARGATGASAPAQQVKYTAWDLSQAGRIKKAQVRAISMLHEGFARTLTHSLGAYLRVVFETNVVSVEQLTFHEFLARIPDFAYSASFNVNPLGVAGVMVLDQSLTFPFIDLLLGGNGAADQEAREITEIEEQILEGVVQILCRELETAWQSLGLQFVSEQRLQPAQIQSLMPPNEKALALSFEIKLPASRGMLNVLFPAVVSNVLLRKLSREVAYQRPHGSAATNEWLRSRVLDCPFTVELDATSISVPVSALLQLQPGAVLRLQHPLCQTPKLVITGQEMFEAVPARKGATRAAQVVRPIESLTRTSEGVRP
jgi:flagellar motor switch protein FliM